MAEQQLLSEVFSTPPRRSSRRLVDSTRKSRSLPSSPRGLDERSLSGNPTSSASHQKQQSAMLFSVEELALATWDSPLVAALTSPARRSSAEERRARSDWSRSRSQSSGDASSQLTPPRATPAQSHAEQDTAASSASSTPERNNRSYVKHGKHGAAPMLSLEGEGSARSSIAPRLSNPPKQSASTTWGTTIMNFTSNYISPASSREGDLSRTESQSDELSDSEQYLNLQELARELRYGEQYLDSETLRRGTEEEKKELDVDEGLRMRQQQQQPWFKYYQQQQQQQPDPPEEIPPTPSEIASSAASSYMCDAKAPDPPSMLQRERSAASSSAVSTKSAATASSSAAKKLQSPFAFMMSRSAEDILNVTAEELEMAHYMSDDHDEGGGDQDEKKNDESDHLRTPKPSSTAANVEITPALLPQPPHAASPGPSPPSSFPSLSLRLNKQRLAVANAMEIIAASSSSVKGASPRRRPKQLPPIGRLATPPPPPPGQPTPPPKPQVAPQQSGTPGTSLLVQQPPKPPATVVSSPPSSTRSTRQDTAIGSGSTAARAMTPIMRIRLGIEEPPLEAPLAAQQPAVSPDCSPSRERVVSPAGTLQTETTARTETDAQTNTSMEESDYYQQQRRWRKKKRMAEGIRRKLARSHGRRSERSGTRYGRGGTSSSRSATSSTLGRSVDDDESSFYSTADLSCQNIFSRLIRTRCGNLDDSASLCENSESEDEDEYYDESVASTLYSDHPKKAKDGRIVSFDDESDDRDARQQKILMLKQKKQMKDKPQVSDHVLERPDTAEAKTRSVEEDIPDGHSIVSVAVSKQESSVSKQGAVSAKGRPLDRLDEVAPQSSIRSIQSVSGSEATSRGRKGGRLHETIATEDSSMRSRDISEESVKISHLLHDGEEHGFDESCTSTSSRSIDERESPQSHENNSWLGVESSQSRASRGELKQDWDVYGDGEANGVEVDALETEGKADSDIQEVIRVILKAANEDFGADLNDVDMHDRNFIKTFVTLASTLGIPLLYHCPAKKLKSLPAPTRVTVRVRLGSEGIAGDFTEPQVTWTSADGKCLGSIELFDIESLDRATTVELRSYPLALPSKSMMLRTEGGDQHIFEAMDEGVAYRFVHGMRWIVARLAFNLIIGNLNVSCELLNVDGDEGVSSDAIEKQVLMKAMNDVTNHLVNKSVQK